MTMAEVMTLTQIETLFDDAWVLISEPVTDEQLNIRSGKVVHHSKNRDEVYRKAVALRPARSAIIYTGKMPEGTAVAL